MRFVGLPFGAAAALLAAVAIAVLLLYLLKPKPQRLTIGSTLIWRQVLRMRSRTPDRLRWWLSLMLALVVALAIALALARPQAVGGSVGARVAIVLDDSATMAAMSVGGKTRFEHAVERARELMRAAGAESRYLIADTAGEIAAPRFEEPSTALRTLERLHVDAGAAPLVPDALRSTDAEVRRVLLSDGIAPIVVPDGVELMSVFQVADNAGITAFAVRPLPGDPRRQQAYVQILNGSPGTRAVQLSIAGAGHAPIVRTLQIAANASADEVIDVSSFEGGPLRADIALADDALPLDNTAFAFIPSRRVLAIGLVGAGDAALERSLRVLPRVHVTHVAAAQVAATAGIDVWIFDRTSPKVRPAAPALLLRPMRVDWLPPIGADIGETTVSGWANHHPVTGALSLRDVTTQHAAPFKQQLQFETIAVDRQHRALAVASLSSPRIVGLAFSLDDSNLAQQPGFPVLLSNALEWLAGETPATQARVGTVVLPIAQAKVLDIRGHAIAVRAVAEQSIVDVRGADFLTAIGPQQRLRVAVGLLDPTVTAINASALANVAPAAPVAATSQLSPPPWIVLLLLAAVLAVVEWGTFNRRLTV